jgi:hypothetical protein
MEKMIHADLIGIGKLLKNSRFSVPPHQRPYAWQQEQVQELYRDVTDAKNRKSEEYFLGTIVLANGPDGRQSIIDGQQRLVTVSVLIAAIRDYFAQNGQMQRAEDIGREYATGLKPSAEAFGLFLNFAALALWSWTCAFAVGALARTTIYVPTIVFCLICLAMEWRLGPISMVLLWTTAWGWLPVVIMCLMVLAPAYHGLRHGAASSKMGGQLLVFLAVGIAVVGILAMWTRGWDGLAMENWSQGGGPLTLVQLVRSGSAWEAVASHLLAISVLTSPALYLLAEQISRRALVQTRE